MRLKKYLMIKRALNANINPALAHRLGIAKSLALWGKSTSATPAVKSLRDLSKSMSPEQRSAFLREVNRLQGNYNYANVNPNLAARAGSAKVFARTNDAYGNRVFDPNRTVGDYTAAAQNMKRQMNNWNGDAYDAARYNVMAANRHNMNLVNRRIAEQPVNGNFIPRNNNTQIAYTTNPYSPYPEHRTTIIPSLTYESPVGYYSRLH